MKELLTTTDGRKFLVRAKFPSGNVRVWGDVTEHDGRGKSVHVPETQMKVLFTPAEIAKIEPVVVTGHVLEGLIQQYLDRKRSEGFIVKFSNTGRKYELVRA